MGQQILPSSDARGKDRRRDVPTKIQTHWVPSGKFEVINNAAVFHPRDSTR